SPLRETVKEVFFPRSLSSSRIVGQVAVSGKHQWIFADEHVNSSCSSFEFCDGWQSQFEARIRTSVLQMQRVGKFVDIIRDKSQASPNKPLRKHFQFNQVQFCQILLRCTVSLAVSLILVQVGTCRS
ncbi:hypothetical protein E1A91_A09G212500v1, partial [Gossypium mustelinum]